MPPLVCMNNPPVVILGMHRTGTSLVARLMSSLGVFMGHQLNDHHEATWFFEMNETLLRIAHAAWDYPQSFTTLLDHSATRKHAEAYLRHSAKEYSFKRTFLGLKHLLYMYSHVFISSKESFVWGWKDPRTTVTFPLWNNVFPGSRYIFVQRNGVDVANSLYVREHGRRPTIHSTVPSLRCLTLSEGFRLWEEYNTIFLKYKDCIPPQDVLYVRYEDLLQDPAATISALADFVQLPVDDTKVQPVVEHFDVQKAYTFMNKPDLLEFYNTVKHSELMRTFNYSAIV